MCGAIIEHTGVCIHFQADQTCFQPHGDMSELDDIYSTKWVSMKLKLIHETIMGKHAQLIGIQVSSLASLNKTRVTS